MFTLTFVLFAVSTLAVNARHASPASSLVKSAERIIGGRNATIEEVPYQVSLQYGGSHYCGGSILSKDYVLTAGHCVGGTISLYSIRAGSSYNYKNGTIHKVTNIIRHSGYGSDDNGHPFSDVAVVKVNPPFVLNAVRKPVVLFNLGEVSPVNATSTISGWGVTENGAAPVLQLVNVPIISKVACYNDYIDYGGIPDGEICAAYPNGGKDSCQGDSGGPLTIGGRQAGIVSWGHGCALAGNPGVYTEVAAHRSWIKANTGI